MAPLKSKKRRVKPAPLRLNLALQGGGSHGAFTWGVLDRLLEEEDIEIVGISGTSAGAMNAAMLVEGMNEGGRARAKEQLEEFWRAISVAAAMYAPASQQAPISTIPGMEQFGWLGIFNPMEMLSRMLSPYEMNPLNLNPLRDILAGTLKCENLHHGIRLFVTATNVETGHARIFRDEEVSIDALMASATLPFLYQAVEIEGVPYWDGGYMGNPSLWPLFYKTDCPDLMLVQINPLYRRGTPKHMLDIMNRLNEISFNSSLLAEMRAIHFVKKMMHEGKLSDKSHTDIHMHCIFPPEDLHAMSASTKMFASWEFFQLLNKAGREQMENWLRDHKKSLGKHSTIDIAKTFLQRPEKTMSPKEPA
ncbi:MAG: patatin-like phospholipase family protein [Rickettsiales bacterium]